MVMRSVQAKEVNLDLQDRWDQLDCQVCADLKVKAANKVSEDWMEKQADQDREGLKGHKDHKASADPPDHRDPAVPMDQLVNGEAEAQLANQDKPVR